MHQHPRLVALQFVLDTGERKEVDGEALARIRVVSVEFPDEVQEALWLRLNDAITVPGTSFHIVEQAPDTERNVSRETS